MLPKTYFLLIPAFFLVSFLYLPAFYNYIVSQDAQYNEWSGWSRCMRYCGESWQGRYRNCSIPSRGMGKTCESLGPRMKTKKCFLRECPIDGHPGEWEQWGKCDKKCVGGKRVRKRPCNNPKPRYFGLACQEAMVEHEFCGNTSPCVVDGQYGNWGRWSDCSNTCGKGSQTRDRKCAPPVGGGKACDKGPIENATQDCNKGDCPSEKEKPKVDSKKTTKEETKEKTKEKPKETPKETKKSETSKMPDSESAKKEESEAAEPTAKSKSR